MEVNVSNYDGGNYDASKEEIHDQFFDKKIIQKINSIFVMYNFQKMKLK